MEQQIEAKSITEYFEQDHNRLDDLFVNFQQSKRQDFKKAKEYFVAFKFGLQRHIIWEEEILFPLFEKQTGLVDQGPTAMMRYEHRMIGEKLEAIHKKVQLADPNSDNEEKELLATLSHHNNKEEDVLYPAIDQIAERLEITGEVFKRMQDLPEERYQKCCED
jgi:regulator of cell morphogenesis and NO signaling